MPTIEAVPHLVIPTKSRDLERALTNCGTRAGIQKQFEIISQTEITGLTLDSAKASLRARISSRHRARFVRNDGFLPVVGQSQKAGQLDKRKGGTG